MDLIDAPLTIRCHLLGEFAVAREQLLAHGIEVGIRDFGIRISFDSLWRAVNRRPAAVTEEGSCLAVTGSSACEAHIHPPDGGVHRYDREGRPLVENLHEGIDSAGVLHGKGRPVQLCAGNEPTRSTGSHSGHDGVRKVRPPPRCCVRRQSATAAVTDARRLRFSAARANSFG